LAMGALSSEKECSPMKAAMMRCGGAMRCIP
jgi:hypothetical protein